MENVSINSAEPTSQTPKIQPMKGKSSRSTSHKSKASGSTVAPRPKSAPVAQKRELSQVYARPISNGHEPEDVPITTEDFNSRLDHHVIKHKLEKFYPIRQDSPNPTLLRFAEAGSQETKKIQEAHGHPETSNEGNYPQSTPTPAQISTMMKVAMYRLVILIDDSGSMQDDQNRIAALGSALQKLTKNIAERFGTEGVTVRCLNYPDFPLLPKKLIEALNSTPPAPGEMDNIQTQGDMYRLFRKLDFTGITDLGGRLRTQIVEPMILGPARQGTLTKPVLVCIITDGEPDSTGKKEVVGRDKKDFRKAIKECKKGLRSAGYPESSVAFHITQVGDSKDATAFLDSLATDRKIGDIVYCTSERMDEQMNLLDSANSEADPRSHFDRFGMWVSILRSSFFDLAIDVDHLANIFFDTLAVDR
ncbi:hypothetical protein DFH27DRAFT_68630 [Peziza echinospora]|nr:hypothetical protein DFH27DRAFT_68630 [Peziza echinospora]